MGKSISLPSAEALTSLAYTPPGQRGDLRFLFYNVENLFDTRDDTTVLDDEFLPYGIKGWTTQRYLDKLRKIYKVIVNVGGWQLPELIGLCEIENRTVLNDLLNRTPLSRTEYGVIHYDSPDVRGIDLALLYRTDAFTPLNHHPVRIDFPFDSVTTRDLLYVEGLTTGSDTLHLILCHFPSRRGGSAASEAKRMYVAGAVRAITDSLRARHRDPAILIAGDFNDEPGDRSITEGLKATGRWVDAGDSLFYNFMAPMKAEGRGSYKFGGYWNMLDQLIVSGGLTDSTGGLYATPQSAQIFEPYWLLKEDPESPGKKPFRTYGGAYYYGGFSDHLPVYLDLFFSRVPDRSP